MKLITKYFSLTDQQKQQFEAQLQEWLRESGYLRDSRADSLQAWH